MPDAFAGFADSTLGPSRRPVSIAPSNTTDLTTIPKAIYVGTGGDVTLIGVDDPGTAGVTFKNVASGMTLDVRARRVLATGTTATDLVAL